MRLPAVLLAALLFALPVAASATTEVISYSPAKLMFFADSLEGEDRVDGSHYSHSVCKIGVSGGVYWTIAGFYKWTGASTFDIFPETYTIVADPKERTSYINTFIRVVYQDLAAALPELQRYKPDQYAGYTKGNDIIEAAFGEFHRERASIDMGPSGRGALSVQGEHDAIAATVSNNQLFLNRESVDFDRSLIKIEIKALPDKVGKPIAALVVDRGVPRWLAKGRC